MGERAEEKITMNALGTHSCEQLQLHIYSEIGNSQHFQFIYLMNTTRSAHDQTAIPRSPQIPEKKTFAIKQPPFNYSQDEITITEH
jgi:hypothetical protein